MQFATKYDKTTILISILVSLLLVSISVAHFVWISPKLPLLSYVTAFIMLAILLIAYILSIKNYTITNTTIIINRVVGKKVIALHDITGTTAVQRNDIKGLIKLVGSGGLFGYYGSFRNNKFGVIYLYATSLQKGIVLTTTKKRYYISPIEIEAFIIALQKQLA